MKRFLLFMLTTLMLVFTCIFFPSPSTTEALISGISGNKFVFTGKIENGPQHYFTDENGESTLVGAALKDSGGTYYSLQVRGENASGWGEFTPTPDMMALIEKGVVYAQFTAKIEPKRASQIKFTLSCGSSTTSISSSGSTATELTSPMLKISQGGKNIKLAFSSQNNCNCVIFEPTLHFYTKISSVTLENKSETVSPGSLIRINAYNDVTATTGASGDFLNYSKQIHKINFDFQSGSQYVDIAGMNLVLKDNIPNNTAITFRVYANKTSYNSTPVYSKYITLTVTTSKLVVKVNTDFSDPATFGGVGEYDLSTSMVTLEVKPKTNFTFEGWYINGVFKSTKTKYTTPITQKTKIYAKFVKSITIDSVSVKSRVYDGTTKIDSENVTVNFNGKEEGHELSLSGVTYSYDSPSAGNRGIVTSGQGTLTGKDSALYKLSSYSIPTSYGEILKRDATVIINSTSKVYGDRDPALTFNAQNLVVNEKLSGSLSRESGDDVGSYQITAGTLVTSNPNYNIIISNNAFLTITRRTVTLQNLHVADKTYDGTKSAQITGFLNNVYGNDDVTVVIVGNFASADVGNNISVRVTDAALTGPKANNYTLDISYSEKLYGSIAKKNLIVEAKATTAIYGDELNLEYSAQGLVRSDTLSGALAIDGKNVGEHEITLGTLANSNYNITFRGAICTIKPRPINVYANKGQKKVYGDEDKKLSFTAPELLSGDTLQGELSREQGNDVGFYDILLGSLNNENYELTLAHEVFEIVPREIEVEISFADKIYDGDTNVKFDVVWNNNIFNADFDLVLDAALSDKNCGLRSVDVRGIEVEGQALGNYTFKYTYKNTNVNITKREALVIIRNATKIYGDSDPHFECTFSNVVGDDQISVNFTRGPGESVGQYPITVSEVENGNYIATLLTENFTILPKVLEVNVSNNEKFFGDEDPQMTFSLADATQLCFDDVEEGLLSGFVTRAQGESVGNYQIDFSKVSANENYTFVAAEGAEFYINKRPVVVTLRDATKIYGEDDPKFLYDVENAVEGEELTIVIKREQGQEVRKLPYQLICATTSDPRYTLEVVAGSLTILPSPIEVKADNKVKFYGDDDPALSVEIVSGALKFNDKLANIFSGSLSRQQGENVGYYTISQGDISLGNNYVITNFESGTLQILAREITISALPKTKVYGQDDSEFEVEITDGKLYFDDQIIGSASRLDGENVGFYPIEQGSIAINENYVIKFISSNLEITPRPVEIIPINISKIYGEKDEEINFATSESLIGDDVLEGEIYRDTSAEDSERAGRYKLYCTLKNSNYEITFGTYYFVIEPRPISIKAKDYEIEYGQSDPEFEYEIVSGQVVDGDSIEGDLYRVEGVNVGRYEIRGDLTLGANYKIEFSAGYLTIKPMTLKIVGENSQKIYGQPDPNFGYSILSGQLINGDLLYGLVTREEGEDVGSYKFVCGLNNPNYAVDFEGGTLTILPKEISLVTTIYNKIYDGTTTATIRNPYLTGLIDKEVYLSYDKFNCAEFESGEVGNKIKVKLHDISLIGEKAKNYKLVLPTEVYGNITHKSMISGDIEISASEAVLFANYTFNGEIATNCDEQIKDHKVLAKIDAKIESDGGEVAIDCPVTITLSLGKMASAYSNLYVYAKDESGQFKLVSSHLEGDKLIINADSLEALYLAADNEIWLDYAFICALAVLVLISFAAAITLFYKLFENKKTSA